MSDTEIRMMRYTMEQLSAELQASRQYVSDIKTELERTSKALDVAKEGLNKYTDASGNWWYGYEFQGHYEDYAGEYADQALAKITALEQKGE